MANVGYMWQIYHDNLLGVTPNQHHMEFHELNHREGGIDEISGPLRLVAIPTPLTGKSADYVDTVHAIQVIISGW